MAVAQIPAALGVAKSLGGIVNKDIKVTLNKNTAAIAVAGSFVGRYDDGSGVLEALIVMDLPLVASLGASLSLIPGGVVKDAIKDKKIEGDMMDNAYEVTNIMANSFVGKRVRLVGFHPPGAAPAEVAQFAATAKQVMFFDVAIPGYPGGIIGFLAPALPA